MNPELDFLAGIEKDVSELLGKSDSIEKAKAFLSHYLQKKHGECIIDMYDYQVEDRGSNGIWACLEFCFAWNINNTNVMIVGPKNSLVSAYDHAMGVI